MIFALFHNITLYCVMKTHPWCYECLIRKASSPLQWLSQWDRLAPSSHVQLKQ